MAKVTRIKANDTPMETDASKNEKPIIRKEVKLKDKKPKKPEKRAAKTENSGKKKPFVLIRPFVYFGRYLRDSWRELRQVRWPSRKATWKMVLAVIVYTAIFMLIISLLDLFFSWLFNNIIK